MHRCQLCLRPFLLIATSGPLLAGGGTPGSSGVPLLEHSAPLLGQTLDVELSQALGGAFTGLAFSPQAGSIPFPFGTVHLDPNGLVLLAQGVTAAAGTKTWSFALPLDAGLAEAQAHLQAFVLDPVATGGIALSNSLDFRLLAGRVYVGWDSYLSATGDRPGMLKAVSTAANALVWSIDLGTSLPGGTLANAHEPAFDADRSRGAAMVSRKRLLVFDDAFGTQLGSLDFAQNCSQVVRATPDGRSLLVLELGDAPKLWKMRFDLSQVQSVALPGPMQSFAGQRFEVHAPSSRAVVIGPGGFHVVDVSNMVHLGALPLTGEPPFPSSLRLSGDQALAVGSQSFPSTGAALHRLDLSTATPATSSLPILGPVFAPPIAVPATGDVLVPFQSTVTPYAFLQAFHRHTLPFPGAPLGDIALSYPDSPLYLLDAVVRGGEVWTLDMCCNEPPDGDEPAKISRLDVAGGSWQSMVQGWTQLGPTGLESSQDALVDALFVVTRSTFDFGSPPPRLWRVDATTLAQTPVDLLPAADPYIQVYSMLSAVPLP